MEQSAKNIHFNGIKLADISRINAEVVARGDYPLAYRNMCRALETQFDTALLEWRRGESPVANMEAALATSGDMLVAIVEWRLDDDTLIGMGSVWNLVAYMSYLLDRPARLPVDRLDRIREEQGQYADVALDYRIFDALEGRDWHDGLEELLERLGSKKRQALAAATYRTYFSLLDAIGKPEQVDTLVKAGEAQYRKRARDSFYEGGPTYMGGGPDNPYVVDFILAAVLKHVGWTGDSVHRWRWSA